MRITGVEIANYRGFAGDSFHLSLSDGVNLLVYGENGAGKSSFYNALKDFLHAASNRHVNIEQRRNRDNPTKSPAIRITTTISPTPVEWTPAVRGQDNDDWRNLDDGKGFLDYRVLLRFYNKTEENSGRIDLFELLLHGMLAHHRIPIAGNPTFLREWRTIELKAKSHLFHWERDALRNQVDVFNAAFKEAAKALAARATELLHIFDPSIGIVFTCEQDAKFSWYPKRITPPRFIAEATSLDHAPTADYHELFNEARLSAMAVCLFFSALQTCPIEGPRLLVLDDVLIGLDMGNRRKVINVIQQLFHDWQIIILTYHKAWFEILKAQVRVGLWGGHPWRSVILRPDKYKESGLVTIAHEDSGTALETADRCLERRDYKGAAVYARTALESALHKHADRLHLSVQFKNDRLKLDTDDFLNPFEERFDHLIDPMLKAQAHGLVAELRFIRRTVLNAFAHADEISEDEITGEVDHGIDVVRQFESFLDHLKKEDFVIAASPLAVTHWLAQARIHAANGNHAAVKYSMSQATKLFVSEYAESACLKMPFKRNFSFGELFHAVFVEEGMTATQKRAFHSLLPYFFGNYTIKDFNPNLLEDAIRVILHRCYRDLLNILAIRANLPNRY